MSKSVISGLEDAIDYQFGGLDLDSGDDDDDEEEDEEIVEVELEAPDWKQSKARDYLFKLCLDPNFPSQDDIRPKQVWEEDPWKVKNRPEFVWFQDYSKFAERLRSARAGKKTLRAKADAEALNMTEEFSRREPKMQKESLSGKAPKRRSFSGETWEMKRKWS